MLGDRERVDLDLLGIGAEERVIELRCGARCLLGEIAGQAQRVGDRAAVMRHEAGRGIDVERLDFFRRVVRDGFDVHAAFGRDDHRHAPGRTVDEQREVEFLVDVGAVGDVQAVDLLARIARLDRHQRVAEHVGRRGADLFLVPCEPDAALGIGAELDELALAAAAGVDLRFDDIERPGQLLRRLDGFLDGQRREPGGDGDTEFGEQFLRLVFMDVHRGPSDFWKKGNGGPKA